MLGKHDGIRAKWFREAWLALAQEYPDRLTGLRRLEAGRVALAWVNLRTASAALEEARRTRDRTHAKHITLAHIERLARRQGLADGSYAAALLRLQTLMPMKPAAPGSVEELVNRPLAPPQDRGPTQRARREEVAASRMAAAGGL